MKSKCTPLTGLCTILLLANVALSIFLLASRGWVRYELGQYTGRFGLFDYQLNGNTRDYGDDQPSFSVATLMVAMIALAIFLDVLVLGMVFVANLSHAPSLMWTLGMTAASTFLKTIIIVVFGEWYRTSSASELLLVGDFYVGPCYILALVSSLTSLLLIFLIFKTR
ncbi:uncharacterized protein MONBRDRAFT_34140 [Monosiga brevicollis MX1]|uniref:Uncharacterized protein n=1 Tax=Monosiga brevicollis TaxID=81824 RepID=A9V9T3_MONBE|nr:uncharacterized protein MONBRDRAFT_34140 [Monosiga brevicollis MX1]EDQ85720.1 predicted protein [Monosiga brevicollis MX1]|eukprot:XP_001749435.1 hypothetical protein [Monosiga brevicollis MX1]